MPGRGPSEHGGEPTVATTTVMVSNKLRGNSHWTLAYMPLQKNLRGEVGKGVLNRRGHFCGGTRTDEEELLGSVELAVGLAGCGNNQSGLEGRLLV
jgi:hypothetical protein